MSDALRPDAASFSNSPAYAAEVVIAFWKIVGFEVTPRTPASLTSLASSPPSSRSRLMLSYHMLWPSSAARTAGTFMDASCAEDSSRGSDGSSRASPRARVPVRRRRLGRADPLPLAEGDGAHPEEARRRHDPVRRRARGDRDRGAADDACDARLHAAVDHRRARGRVRGAAPREGAAVLGGGRGE